MHHVRLLGLNSGVNFQKESYMPVLHKQSLKADILVEHYEWIKIQTQ